MKKLFAVIFVFGLMLFGASLSGYSQDVKDVAEKVVDKTKDTAKKVANETKKGAKKVTEKSKDGVVEAAD